MEHSADLPNNADRAALAKILTLVNYQQDCQAAVRGIEMLALIALNAPPAPGDYWERWLPAAEHINALPQPVRSYIHDLETNVDPAGMVAENVILRDTVAAMEA